MKNKFELSIITKHKLCLMLYLFSFISFLIFINYLDVKEKGKIEQQQNEINIKHDTKMMKMGMVMYRNYLFIYNHNEKKADSAYYANDKELCRSIYKEFNQIPN